VDFARVRVGDLVWRSFDPTLPRRLKRLTAATTPVYTRPVSFAVTARSGAPLQLVAQTANGHSARDTGIVQGDRILIPCNDVDRRLESDLITGS
jgi:hypothetical protein